MIEQKTSVFEHAKLLVMRVAELYGNDPTESVGVLKTSLESLEGSESNGDHEQGNDPPGSVDVVETSLDSLKDSESNGDSEQGDGQEDDVENLAFERVFRFALHALPSDTDLMNNIILAHLVAQTSIQLGGKVSSLIGEYCVDVSKKQDSISQAEDLVMLLLDHAHMDQCMLILKEVLRPLIHSWWNSPGTLVSTFFEAHVLLRLEALCNPMAFNALINPDSWIKRLKSKTTFRSGLQLFQPIVDYESLSSDDAQSVFTFCLVFLEAHYCIFEGWAPGDDDVQIVFNVLKKIVLQWENVPNLLDHFLNALLNCSGIFESPDLDRSLLRLMLHHVRMLLASGDSPFERDSLVECVVNRALVRAEEFDVEYLTYPAMDLLETVARNEKWMKQLLAAHTQDARLFSLAVADLESLIKGERTVERSDQFLRIRDFVSTLAQRERAILDLDRVAISRLFSLLQTLKDTNNSIDPNLMELGAFHWIEESTVSYSFNPRDYSVRCAEIVTDFGFSPPIWLDDRLTLAEHLLGMEIRMCELPAGQHNRLWASLFKPEYMSLIQRDAERLNVDMERVVFKCLRRSFNRMSRNDSLSMEWELDFVEHLMVSRWNRLIMRDTQFLFDLKQVLVNKTGGDPSRMICLSLSLASVLGPETWMECTFDEEQQYAVQSVLALCSTHTLARFLGKKVLHMDLIRRLQPFLFSISWDCF